MPVLYILFCFFLMLNFLLIFSHDADRNELSLLTNIVKTYGSQVNDKVLVEMGKEYETIIGKVNDLSPYKDLKFLHPSELVENERFLTEQPLNQKDLNRLQEFRIFEAYYRSSKEIDQVYQEVNVKSAGEEMSRMYGFTGRSAETVNQQFLKLDERLQELIKREEHKYFFFMGTAYEMHSLLFKDLGRALLFEIMILIVLLTSASTNYEFEQKTALVSYTTKRGRKLVRDKGLATLSASGMIILLLVGATLAAFFMKYDYTGLWQVPISSYFNAELRLPYITWWNVTFSEYLLLFICLMIVSGSLFLGITYILSLFLKNTYLVFFCFGILVGGGILLPSYMPLDGLMIFYMHYNPFSLILNPHEWFMGNGPFTIYKNYEIVTVLVWTVIVLFMIYLSMARFKRQSIQ
nr:hypothetical protein [Bacillus weihaiensis]